MHRASTTVVVIVGPGASSCQEEPAPRLRCRTKAWAIDANPEGAAVIQGLARTLALADVVSEARPIAVPV